MASMPKVAAPKPPTAPRRSSEVWLNIAFVVVAGLLAARVFPPTRQWWLGWVALAPLLLALRNTRVVRAAGWLALLFGQVFFAASLPWISAIFGSAAVGIFFLMALPLVLFGLAYRVLAGQGRPWLTVLLTPALWVAVDWIRCEGWYFQFSWCQLGFGFATCPNSVMLFSTVGVYGGTFLLMLANALLAEILATPIKWPRRLVRVLNCAALVLVFSVVLLLPPAPLPPTGTALRVALVQGEMGDLEYFRGKTLALKNERPDLIVWPELAVAAYVRDDPRAMAELSALAKTMRAVLVLGTKEHMPADTPCDWLRRRAMEATDGAVYANSALVFGPDGKLLGSYHKRHPIQFFADGVPGRRQPDIPSPLGTLGLAICYDFDYAGTNIRMVGRGAELLVVPTFDAIEWTAVQHLQHGDIARARAAEAGRWIARATSSGESMVINPQGLPTALIPVGQEEAAITTITPLTTRTPYMRWGYLLPYLCLLASALWSAGRIRDWVCGWRKQQLRKLNEAGTIS